MVILMGPVVDRGTRTRGRSQLIGNSASASGSVTQGPSAEVGAPNIPTTLGEVPSAMMGVAGKSVHGPLHMTFVITGAPPTPMMPPSAPMFPAKPPKVPPAPGPFPPAPD